MESARKVRPKHIGIGTTLHEKSIFPASDRCQHHKDAKEGVGFKLLAKKVESARAAESPDHETGGGNERVFLNYSRPVENR
jgi:hypothetical protein